MAPLYERAKRVLPEALWAQDAPLICVINQPKRERFTAEEIREYRAALSHIVGFRKSM